MNFKQIFNGLVLVSVLALQSSCSDEANETQLVNLHTTAAQDVISLQFPANTETVLSINSTSTLSVEGLKTNGVDKVNLSSEITWSVSPGASSQINQRGQITASANAETFTVTAQLGILSTSIDIRISDARFDRVVSLDEQVIALNMCQSQIIEPMGRYIDSSGNPEFRKVDNTLIDTIDWIVLNAADNSVSQNAYIETVNKTTTLYSLAAADLIIQAQAPSPYSGNVETSDNLDQNIGNALNSIKICSSNASDYSSCSVDSPSVKQDQQTSFIAIGNYPSSGYENITRTTKWGLSDNNISAVLSADLQQIDITGELELQTSTLSFACGEIQQPLSSIDITQGIILDSAVDCAVNCQGASVPVKVDKLTVASWQVSANSKELTHNESITIAASSNEIELVVKVTYSNDEQLDITSASTLEYTIINITGQPVIIEEKANTPGTFTILNTGTTKIQLDYRDEVFIVPLDII